MHSYQKRPIRFMQLLHHDGWSIKVYSISAKAETVERKWLELAKSNLGRWLQQSNNYPLANYKIATLILHEGKEGCFAVINWWIDENMLQLHVYLSSYDGQPNFELYSNKGMASCVWELAVLWHERNAWVEHVLAKAPLPDYDTYLKQQLNTTI